jgi:hypothetical protein
MQLKFSIRIGHRTAWACQAATANSCKTFRSASTLDTMSVHNHFVAYLLNASCNYSHRQTFIQRAVLSGELPSVDRG